MTKHRAKKISDAHTCRIAHPCRLKAVKTAPGFQIVNRSNEVVIGEKSNLTAFDVNAFCEVQSKPHSRRLPPCTSPRLAFRSAWHRNRTPRYEHRSCESVKP
jgi:hypothetical protein